MHHVRFGSPIGDDEVAESQLWVPVSPFYKNQSRASRRVNGKDINGYRSEEHTSALPSLMRMSYAVFCLHQKMPLRTRDTSTTTIYFKLTHMPPTPNTSTNLDITKKHP